MCINISLSLVEKENIIWQQVFTCLSTIVVDKMLVSSCYCGYPVSKDNWQRYK